jgi:hypothetical protein
MLVGRQGMQKVIPDVDIWRCLKLLIDQHGDGAQIEAIDKATLMGSRGDMAGQCTGLGVFEAITDLCKPPQGHIFGF